MIDVIPRVHKKQRCNITPDEDTKLECRNVGSSMLFDRALYSFKHNQSSERNTSIVDVNKLTLKTVFMYQFRYNTVRSGVVCTLVNIKVYEIKALQCSQTKK